MERMVRRSFVHRHKYSAHAFAPGAGYHIPNGGSSAILSRSSTLVHDPSLSGAVYPLRNSRYRIDRERLALRYVQSTLKKIGLVERRDHTPYNMTEEQVRRLDHFFLFANILLQTRWYQEITMTVKGGGPIRPRFNRLPFQQMMLLDFLMTMIERSGLSEHRVNIVMHLKTRLGLDWLTHVKARLLTDRFATKSSGYVIPRRCGKSSFVGTLMTLSMAACPFAGIKGLYTAHDRRLVQETFTRVSDNIDKVMTEFNAYQLYEFHSRKRANNGEAVPGDYYFRAEGEKRMQTGVIKVKFLFMDDHGVRHYPGDPDLENTLLCRVYAKENALRGATFNVMIGDETNFLPPPFYDEVLPQVSTGNGRMILMSSQKCGQNKKAFIDLSTIRMDGMLMNVVGYMCRRHLMSTLRSPNVSITRCLCNFFRSPLHIVTDKPFRRMMTLFSTRTGGDESEEDAANSKSAMLSEVGGIPAGMKKEDITTIDLNRMELANENGNRHMTVETIPVENYVVTGVLKNMTFANDVVIYVDPAPTDQTRSYAAMCFTTRAFEYEPESSKRRVHYVILAIEEFRPRWVDRENQDELYALAVVFMSTVRAVSMLYSGYFKRFIVVPEANAMSVDRFWAHCGALMARPEFTEFIQEWGITILSTVIESTPPKQSKTSRKLNSQKQAEKRRERSIINRFHPFNSFAARLQRSGRDYVTFDKSADAQKTIDALDRVMYRTELEELTRAEVAMNEEIGTDDDQPTRYRLGYTLGSDKVSRFWNFFSSCYNKSNANLSDVTCARLVYSYMLTLKGVSIPTYIVDALSALTMRRKGGARSMPISYIISGKRVGSKHESPHFHRDDLATAVVCSVTMCADILDQRFTGRFLRLDLQTFARGNPHESPD